ncbi:MAG: TraB/GumN family protein, partial [Cyanothece sp. SIO1E1]|nr:TraB/GumN family protein [Cyanothece sp. SIO1E1]
QRKAAEIGLPIAAFDSFEPWFFVLSLVTLKLQSLGFDPNYGVDRYFFNQAVQANKEILGLETVSDQLSLFDNLSAQDQEAYVQQTLLEFDTLETSFQSIIDAWKAGDAETLGNLIFESFEQYPAIRQKLFDERNQKWVPQIEALLQQDDDYLIVVGAGHLIGEGSVIDLLQDKGYVAKQF